MMAEGAKLPRSPELLATMAGELRDYIVRLDRAMDAMRELNRGQRQPGDAWHFLAGDAEGEPGRLARIVSEGFEPPPLCVRYLGFWRSNFAGPDEMYDTMGVFRAKASAWSLLQAVLGLVEEIDGTGTPPETSEPSGDWIAARNVTHARRLAFGPGGVRNSAKWARMIESGEIAERDRPGGLIEFRMADPDAHAEARRRADRDAGDR